MNWPNSFEIRYWRLFCTLLLILFSGCREGQGPPRSGAAHPFRGNSGGKLPARNPVPAAGTVPAGELAEAMIRMGIDDAKKGISHPEHLRECVRSAFFGEKERDPICFALLLLNMGNPPVMRAEDWVDAIKRAADVPENWVFLLKSKDIATRNSLSQILSGWLNLNITHAEGTQWCEKLIRNSAGLPAEDLEIAHQICDNVEKNKTNEIQD